MPDIAIIGGGFIAQLAHIGPLAALSNVRLTALAEPDPGLLEKVGRAHGFKKSYSDYHDLLDTDDFDALIVCLPLKAQELVVREALAKGKPVLSEKPMALTLDAAQSLAGVADKARASWTIGFMKRHDPGVQQFREMLQDPATAQRLGQVRHVAMRDFCARYGVNPPDHFRREGSRAVRYPEAADTPEWLPDELGDGYRYCLNVMSHDVNLLRFLFGEDLALERFSADPANTQRASFAVGDVPIDLVVAHVWTGVWDQQIDVTFANGRLSLIIPSPLNVNAYARIECRDHNGVQEVEVVTGDTHWAFARQAQNFVAGLENGSDSSNKPLSCLQDMKLIDAMWRSVVA
ncbi:Gfo/Idh/MocA family protein [Ahrensia sp. R2A130]|uniref:Gfo/Idh/MocA family protein n=1 Tax=Ahrensia sp. R2A130 TaxID=744979 RepID=UPI0001E08C2D|nr:Gfo/Idh/MocA family oxidoreductase [Ahrensia sp. R2A130]EFL89531.1 putative SpcB [Ahrensia sp. R2A130]